MERLYVFIIRNDIWIYILCAIGLVWYAAELVRARSLLRGAMFGLERERGRRMQNRAAILVLFFISVAALVTFVNLQIAPTLPADLLKPPTPTPNAFTTPAASPISQVESEESVPLATATLAVAPTVTLANGSLGLSGEPDGDQEQEQTGQAETSAFADVDIDQCSSDINISAPPSGVTVVGDVSVFGTANSEYFGYYDLEIIGPSTNEQWVSVYEILQREPLIDDILVTMNLDGFESGSYLLRLRVTDLEGIEAGQCVILIEVS